jgi:hypothetical protein
MASAEQPKARPVMGFAWYDAASFEALKARMPDMSASYEDWRICATRDLRHHEAQGYRVIRISLRPPEFFAWCAGRGVAAPGVRERRQFAAEGARTVLRAEQPVARRGFGLF